MTLFLDRDGVINDEIRDGYVLRPDMFHFSEGVLAAMPILANRFERIIVITNQRCIGRGLLTTAGLQEIHTQMLQQIERHGGKIDGIYFCPDVDSNSPCRKPATGMGMQAKHDFPDIDFSTSVMVGNTLSDMQFGKSLGMQTIFIPSTRPETPFPHPLIDQRYQNLLQFAQAVQ
ncbi:D-glycero-D-manno-heptose 1,7-bisphosphate phosphatase [Chitinophaga ginsengisegetis]|uniref:D,D-heptose 1,7-bisphosphate phosphatase n=1 Tax=Chitinophaga ginsengisegetis TaxID=393003 RepID=A0A1T5N8G6_9BACT|nr:HAD-IIIA family hydrolase [Chitinophaga ginsengisegetis]MDR6568501.1 histidinol-phosphate phosphatase family protein [Chitinophaga ginsengisegetis]MDR6648268.1 histidinol-phosphate phosphatase family protein [Chitinophaga ginsengisegetis]MDR6654582.1 histidinol-phosphate phosphatase family protein [Chitinophaga ginsengisegetis]SKC96746.1 D-glycero-D-manno-heptose 1,7-bisphosphate phosphatase [Chitinophaga ginsengisegetis]